MKRRATFRLFRAEEFPEGVNRDNFPWAVFDGDGYPIGFSLSETDVALWCDRLNREGIYAEDDTAA